MIGQKEWVTEDKKMSYLTDLDKTSKFDEFRHKYLALLSLHSLVYKIRVFSLISKLSSISNTLLTL